MRSVHLADENCKFGSRSAGEGIRFATDTIKISFYSVPIQPNAFAIRHVDLTKKELDFNPKFEELFAPVVGPDNPFKSEQCLLSKNILTGFVENAHFNDFHFEIIQRRFCSNTAVLNITLATWLLRRPPEVHTYIVGVTVFEPVKKKDAAKRKKLKNMDPADVEGFTGPWAAFEDENRSAKPDPETMKCIEEFLRKRKKISKITREEGIEEKSVLHSMLKDPYDYQGRSFLVPPHDVGVNLRDDIHTWTGHTKGVQAIRWFPGSAHLLLSASMDCKIKLWEVYKQRRCIRTYVGHKMAVRDVCFNNAGTEFLSASYDRYIKLWDAETGECKQRFTTGKVPYCIKFHPDEDKQNIFLAGMQDKKIIQVCMFTDVSSFSRSRSRLIIYPWLTHHQLPAYFHRSSLLESCVLWCHRACADSVTA
ncbi:unnamed protein product, partial [Soboliphyme baturini]|uniref:WD_REPEATS_REGION domain-containing protein n=1 Tax=Soboliphyme baturini TaxID=241478 RepID=A0A183J6B5_9BILA